MINKVAAIVSTLPFLLGLGAGVLFIMGYTAHAMFGKDSVLEEVAEELLSNKYNIDVEFSVKKVEEKENE